MVEYEAGRKVTYSAVSDLHTATHALHFMPDPNDPGFTNIRYLKRMQLRGSAGPLQPLISGVGTVMAGRPGFNTWYLVPYVPPCIVNRHALAGDAAGAQAGDVCARGRVDACTNQPA